jgi:hypothetical protein
MADVRHNLRFGHFVGRFHRDVVSAGLLFLESLFQFALGLAGTKDQNRSSITNISNNLVVVACEIPGVSSLARIIGRNFLVFEPTNRRFAGTPKLLLHIGLDALCFFSIF